jgi:hypothetical protein
MGQFGRFRTALLRQILRMQERITHPCKQKKEETNKMNETGKPSGGNSADLVVYGKIFTSENQTVEAFAVKDGRYVYAGDRKGARAFIEEGRTEGLLCMTTALSSLASRRAGVPSRPSEASY